MKTGRGRLCGIPFDGGAFLYGPEIDKVLEQSSDKSKVFWGFF